MLFWGGVKAAPILKSLDMEKLNQLLDNVNARMVDIKFVLERMRDNDKEYTLMYRIFSDELQSAGITRNKIVERLNKALK